MLGKFEDDYFADELKPRDSSHQGAYEVKQREYEWYASEEHDGDEDFTQILRHRADTAYRNSDYAMAVTLYAQILDRSQHDMGISPQMRREVNESLARSHLHMDNPQDALKIALSMCETASKNQNYRTCSLLLLANVYHKMNDHANEILTCIELLQMHSVNANLWGLFADAFARHWKVTKTQFEKTVEFHDDVNNAPSPISLLTGLTLKHVCLILGCCFIRISKIHEGFGKKLKDSEPALHSSLEKTAKKWLAVLPLPKNFYRNAEKIFGEDVLDEKEEVELEIGKNKISEDQQCDEIPSTTGIFLTDQSQFYARWFGWLELYY